MGFHDLGSERAGRVPERQVAGTASLGRHGVGAEPKRAQTRTALCRLCHWQSPSRGTTSRGMGPGPRSQDLCWASPDRTLGHTVWGFDGFRVRVPATFLGQGNLANLQEVEAGARPELPEGYSAFHQHLPKSDDVENSLRGGEGLAGEPKPMPPSSDLETASLDRGPQAESFDIKVGSSGCATLGASSLFRLLFYCKSQGGAGSVASISGSA